jgi:acyl carrier protein
MSTEDEFVRQALKFLAEIGADTSEVDPQTHLIATGVLDSLGTLAFLDFIEQQSGTEIEVETLDLEAISTLHGAYEFVVEQKQ